MATTFSSINCKWSGYKLDLTLVSTLMKSWRLETNTFHLPCDECNIILENMQLQLGLPVDRSIVTGSVYTIDWRGVCGELLGLVSERIYGGQIKMSWLRRNFGDWMRIPLKSKQNDMLERTSFRSSEDNIYEFLPTCEASVAPELSCGSDYMSWFRTHGKPYLYREEARSWQSYTKRPRPALIHQ
ncbi:hypothetical protein J1N35_038408 [Gossypium stocksii]|uniref:Aminotransferase-like plant mobile domain-containing protein n=1 Tax=Gossypium stocksii TaxID=47602 RepID=A0A9D3UNT1_9ROSI|nr:hypothetical protein J1N35_038408 [Gossypium stocksii]